MKTKMHVDIVMDVLPHLQSQLSSQAERKKSTKIYVIFSVTNNAFKGSNKLLSLKCIKKFTNLDVGHGVPCH